MSSLPQVLHEASSRSANEIILEAGQSPMIRTDAGAVTVGDAMTERDLFDALGQVLSPEQQAELAVGNVVEFMVDTDGGRWTLLTEPGPEGVVVRGKLQGSEGSELGIPLDLPPLEPFQTSDAADLPRPPTPGIRRRTQWDIAVSDVEPDPEEEGAVASVPAPNEASPDTHGWKGPLSANMSEAETADAEPDFELRTPTGEAPANLVDARFDTGERSEALPELLAPPLPGGKKGSETFRRAETRAQPRRRSERETQNDGAFEQYGKSIVPGTLCFVQGRHAAQQLASSVDGGAFTVIDDDDTAEELRSAAHQDPGGTYLLRLEDPSTCLGWVLRRLEEGGRVVVETRARTSQGARRTLLGTGAGPRAEAWLDAHPTCWLVQENDEWTLHTD